MHGSSQSARKVPGLPSVCTANTNLLCVILDWLKYIYRILLCEVVKENVILAVLITGALLIPDCLSEP